ncbi:MAG: nuclear transport factor 2 family protein [Rhizomicrobium sp.]
MTTGELSTLDRMAITQGCIDLIYRFALKNDARDYDALAEMFVADGVFRRPSLPDVPYEGREAIRAGFRARPASLLTRHIVCNPTVSVLSATEARAESYILLYSATVAEDTKLPVPAAAKALLGAFDDRMVRDGDGVWKFKARNGSLAMTLGG